MWCSQIHVLFDPCSTQLENYIGLLVVPDKVVAEDGDLVDVRWGNTMFQHGAYVSVPMSKLEPGRA